MTSTKTIILASQSRDRKRLLKSSKIPHVVIISEYEEEIQPKMSSKQLALHHAHGKANSVVKMVRENPLLISTDSFIIIAADTVVDFNGETIGKAKDQAHAMETLKKLVGKTHSLITGVVIYDSETDTATDYQDSTLVKFSSLSDDEIRDYITHSDEYKWRAGCYSIFGRASIFIESISGSPSNVIGLSMDFVFRTLKKYGLSVLKMNNKNKIE